jgi:hypothetical protein
VKDTAHLSEDRGDLRVWLADVRQRGGAAHECAGLTSRHSATGRGQGNFPCPVVGVGELAQQLQVVVFVGVLQRKKNVAP